MTTETFFLTELQSDLTRAFKWMAKATQEAQEGELGSANQSIMFALEYWMKCQHVKDKFITDEVAEKINWKFFTLRALSNAKKEYRQEFEDEQENA